MIECVGRVCVYLYDVAICVLSKHDDGAMQGTHVCVLLLHDPIFLTQPIIQRAGKKDLTKDDAMYKLYLPTHCIA